MRNHKVRLFIKTKEQLRTIVKCDSCEDRVPFGELLFYVDEANISITNNAKGICLKCSAKNGAIEI